jgi:hypothetical protein
MDDWSHNHLLPESPLYPFARVPAITPGIREEPFLLLVLGGYMLATRGKTLYQWLHGGYMSQE